MTYAIQRMLELHLELSKQHPLFLDLTLTNSAEGAVGVLKSLAQHCSRWEAVSFNFCRDLFYSEVLSSVSGNLPRLKSVVLCGHGYRIPNDSEGWKFFQSTPALRRVALTECSALELPVDLPWNQLTHLRLDWWRVHSQVDRLKKATEARNLTLVYCYLDEEPETPSTMVHRNIEALTLLTADFDDNEASFIRILRYFNLPNLTHLKLSTFVGSDRDSYILKGVNSEVGSFLTRSECNLTSLSLVNFIIPQDQLVNLFRHLPSLSALTIHESEEPDKDLLASGVFNLITVNHRKPFDSVLLPRLKELDIRFRSVTVTYLSSLTAMLESRWITDIEFLPGSEVQCLTSVTLRPFIKGDKDTSALVLESLRALKAAGLRVSMFPQLLGSQQSTDNVDFWSVC
ncbi:hypothetical protein K435DRAFT_842758 [Dendrothele bispora CBS 962.96]|uniref:F-box domain-containing protein n=1 Tax=Dendrothele bispora (strain CBS 962.96) TaxID=1314807 RepID=A0A4S8LEJ3_DENBC|nr:hypothetical protein K435DRAFT_842758 [Dendrothele bispora CBS 962.96]